MQGFNRYIPPDFDPKKTSTLNAYQGKKHALGKRAKDIDKGVLVVRFELPFNIWCGTCNNHIGAGVRYNAQKRKVGNYYSTPIYAFRCKCHLCSGWFEIRTDPQNAAYVVSEGARKQESDWDPVENGGHAVYDTEAPSAAPNPDGTPLADPFESLEKDTDQRSAERAKKSRLTELYDDSARRSADPYAVSRALRDRFRVEKRDALAKQAADEGVKEKYGLGEDVVLGDEWEVLDEWTAARAEAPPSVDDGLSLGERIRKNTRTKYDVFDAEPVGRVRLPRAGMKRKAEDAAEATPPARPPPPPAAGLGGLAGYGSGSDSD
ncbi:Coiled-coil domain-containing protein [Vanrija pseudolonga]|uniref:Coiled-coil domain-containing protein n=1 Tax=Vanrija pseudolonga TaxID=143232 RepID=A0AAF0YG15_9TREE|nr:Coiled-coil domain-containing protein [Vanrija pseudolonga]